MKLCLSETEIAWIAGLFEGEAYFGIDSRSKMKYETSESPPAPFIKISMVDKDVIEKVANLLKKKFFSPSRKTSTNKTVYTIHIGDRSTLLYLLPLILPYMGIRRQKKIQECLEYLYVWEKWYIQGGRNKMARIGALKKNL